MKSKETIKNRIVNIDYEKSKVSWIYYMPLLLIAGFVPLIVYGKYVDLTGTTQALYWTGQNQLLDFFSYWKSRWVIFLTATALVIYIFLVISKKLPFKKEYKYYIPLSIYAFFVILSTMFAIDVPTALNGFMDMYQGMWVLLSYVTITFLVINYVNCERDVKLFLYAFIFLIIVEGIIGVGQYFGFDIFNTKFGNHFIIPSGVQVNGGLNFNFGKHTIYGTLFNTNYVGSFATLMLPMVITFVVTAKSIKKRILGSIALLLCIFTWIGCNSRAGYVGVVFALFVAIIMLRKYILKHWKICLAVCVIGVIGTVGFNYISDGMLFNKIGSMNIFKIVPNIRENNDSAFKFESIELDKDTVSIKTTYQYLKIKVDGDKIVFLDYNNNILPIKQTEDNYLVVDMLNSDYLKVKINKAFPGFTVCTKWTTYGDLNFYIDDNNIKILIGNGILYDNVNKAKSIRIFDNFQSFASNRGFIWGRTIPMLKDYIICGAGADNFIFTFPHNDIVDKMNLGWWRAANVIVDKPHNMYIQIAMNTGFTSLLIISILWVYYIVSGVKLYWKSKFNSFNEKVGFSCLVSVIGYLVAGIFNDYIVSISPLFWIILGIGISINQKLLASVRKENER